MLNGGACFSLPAGRRPALRSTQAHQVAEYAIRRLLHPGLDRHRSEGAHQIRVEQNQVAGPRRARQNVVPLQHFGAHAQSDAAAGSPRPGPQPHRLALPPRPRPRLPSRTVLPSRAISIARSGVSRVIPRVVTSCGVVRASISTLASAAVFAAESQPSTSYAPSASVIPILRASARPASKLPPLSIVSITTFDVEFSTPVNPSTFTPGIVCRHRLNTGAPSITLDSKRKPTPSRAASSRSAA